MKLQVKKIIEICEGTLLCGNEELTISSFSKDTRTIQKNDCYVGIKGESFDGNAFYEEAFQKGASACLLDSFEGALQDEDERVIILVKDTVIALQKLAAYVRSQLNIPVIAVTGSVGKTTTKDLIASLLSQKYKVLKSPGNLNGQIGLPLNILKYQDEDVLVLEMGMNDFGQIETLSKIAQPTIAVITNIGTAHLGILGSRENILKAKLEILSGMANETPIVLNYDNDLLKDVKLENHPTIFCSTKEKMDYYATDIHVTKEKTEFVVHTQNKKEVIKLPLMGEIFVSNALLAIAVGSLLNLDLATMKQGLENLNTQNTHMQFISLKNGSTLIDDSYNSNLEALASALKTLLQYPGNRHIAVLGDILELNEYAKTIHEQVGALKEIQKVDALFLQGENAYYIGKSAEKNGLDPQKIHYFTTKEELTHVLSSFLKEKDICLIKASNGMKFQEIIESLKNNETI